MQIAIARQKAATYVNGHIIESRARRPAKDAKVMVRYPMNQGDLLMAENKEVLTEKLARRIQGQSRRMN